MASGAWAPERDRPTSPQPPLQDSGPPQAGRAVPCDTGEGSACSQAPGPGFPGGGPASARTEFGELGPVPPVAAVAAWGPPPRMQPGVCVTCWYTGRSSHRSPRGAPRAGWEETQGNVSEEKGPVLALQAGRCGHCKGKTPPQSLEATQSLPECCSWMHLSRGSMPHSTHSGPVLETPQAATLSSDQTEEHGTLLPSRAGC